MKKKRISAVFLSTALTCMLALSVSANQGDVKAMNAAPTSTSQHLNSNLITSQRLTVEGIKGLEQHLSGLSNYGGIYLDGDKAIVQLTGKKEVLTENSIKQLTSVADKIQFTYVKYSDKQLHDANDKITKALNGKHFSNLAWGYDTVNNKIKVFSSNPEVQALLESDLDPNMIEYADDLVLQDQSAVQPAQALSGSVGNGFCTIAFNAKIGTTHISVTAGHCTVGATFSLGSTSFGSVLGAPSSGTTVNADAGYWKIPNTWTGSINSNDAVTGIPVTSYDTNYNDYVGEAVTINSNSGTTNTSYSLSVFMKSVQLSDTITGVTYSNQRLCSFNGPVTTNGTSGAPVYYQTYNYPKNRSEYMIEGIHKGTASSSGTTYEVYSNVQYAFSQLGLSSIDLSSN